MSEKLIETAGWEYDGSKLPMPPSFGGEVDHYSLIKEPNDNYAVYLVFRRNGGGWQEGSMSIYSPNGEPTIDNIWAVIAQIVGGQD